MSHSPSVYKQLQASTYTNIAYTVSEHQSLRFAQLVTYHDQSLQFFSAALKHIKCSSTGFASRVTIAKFTMPSECIRSIKWARVCFTNIDHFKRENIKPEKLLFPISKQPRKWMCWPKGRPHPVSRVRYSPIMKTNWSSSFCQMPRIKFNP